MADQAPATRALSSSRTLEGLAGEHAERWNEVSGARRRPRRRLDDRLAAIHRRAGSVDGAPAGGRNRCGDRRLRQPPRRAAHSPAGHWLSVPDRFGRRKEKEFPRRRQTPDCEVCVPLQSRPAGTWLAPPCRAELVHGRWADSRKGGVHAPHSESAYGTAAHAMQKKEATGACPDASHAHSATRAVRSASRRLATPPRARKTRYCRRCSVVRARVSRRHVLFVRPPRPAPVAPALPP